jgi:hypothetical protein
MYLSGRFLVFMVKPTTLRVAIAGFESLHEDLLLFNDMLTCSCLGMAMGRVRVEWSKYLTHDKSDSGENSNPHLHPWVKFQTRTRQVCKWAGPILLGLVKCAKWSNPIHSVSLLNKLIIITAHEHNKFTSFSN